MLTGLRFLGLLRQMCGRSWVRGCGPRLLVPDVPGRGEGFACPGARGEVSATQVTRGEAFDLVVFRDALSA